jgi:hypothetical protein
MAMMKELFSWLMIFCAMGFTYRAITAWERSSPVFKEIVYDLGRCCSWPR